MVGHGAAPLASIPSWLQRQRRHAAAKPCFWGPSLNSRCLALLSSSTHPVRGGLRHSIPLLKLAVGDNVCVCVCHHHCKIQRCVFISHFIRCPQGKCTFAVEYVDEIWCFHQFSSASPGTPTLDFSYNTAASDEYQTQHEHLPQHVTICAVLLI